MLPGVSRATAAFRRARRHVYWCVLLCVLSQAALASAQTATPARDPRFGAVEAFWAPDEAARVGLGWERILFFWSEIQPAGPEDWNTWHVDDRWLARAQADGREVVGVLKQTPAWATDGLPAAGVPRGLYRPLNDPANLWANFVRRAASYYGPRGVHHWIIWNEPDIAPDVYGHEFSGSVADYYQLVKVAYQVMRAVDPQAVIHLAGLTYWHDELAGRPQYLERFLAVAAADPAARANGFFFDVISLHIYFRVETIPNLIAAMNEIQQAYGLAKPIWINETNAAPNLDPEWPVTRPEFQVDLAQQAWFVVQALALGLAAGAERMEIYKFTDVLAPPGSEPFGLLRADLSPRPALTAFATTIAQLGGFTAVSGEMTAASATVTFALPDRQVRVVWARQAQPVRLSLPASADSASLIDIFGVARRLTPIQGRYTLDLAAAHCTDECLMGGPPLFVVEARRPTPTPTATAAPLAPAPTPLPSPSPSATPQMTAVPTAPLAGPPNSSTRPTPWLPGWLMIAAAGLTWLGWRLARRRAVEKILHG